MRINSEERRFVGFGAFVKFIEIACGIKAMKAKSFEGREEGLRFFR